MSVIGIWGDDKAGKTTVALTAPRPILYMEYDIGGFERARRNIGDIHISDWVKDGSIIHKRYVMPFQVANFDPVKNIVRPSKIVTGVKELFYRWLGDYMKAVQDTKVASIVIDTGTLLWEVVTASFLQEKQELQLDNNGNVRPGEKLRTQLLQIEYKEPNIRMRGIVYQAKANGKHLIMTHHSRDEYGIIRQSDGTMGEGRTGKKERNGWAQLGDGADLILHTYIKEEPVIDDTTNRQIIVNGKKQVKRVPYCSVDLAEVQELVGMEFREPTLDSITEVIKMIREGTEN